MTLARFRPAWRTDLARFEPAWEAAASTALEIVAAVDGGNIDQSAVTIDNTGEHPVVTLDTRSAAGPWRHAFFAVDNAEGLRPIFRLSLAKRENAGTISSDWIPSYTQDTTDHTSWVRAPSRTIANDQVEWQFTDPLPAGRVYVGDQPMGRVSDTTAFAQELLSTHAAVASPSLGANASGVFNTSPAETDENGRAIGEQPMYSIRLAWGGATTDGNPKREHVDLTHMHAAGEGSAWISFRYAVDWMLNSATQAAQDFRSNFNVTLIFAATPNGLFGGEARTNFRSSLDPNREWDFNNLAEITAIKSHLSAVIADTGHFDSFFSWHGWIARSERFLAYVVPEDNNVATRSPVTQAIFDEVGLILGGSPITATSGTSNTDIWWAQQQGAQVYIDVEIASNGSTALQTYQDIGEAWVRGLQAIDADGVFYPITIEPGQSVANGQTLTVQAGVSVVLSAGQAVANGQTLTPAAGTDVTIAAAQATANGQTLAPTVGVSVNLQAGQAIANGQTLTTQVGTSVSVSVVIQPAQAVANGQTITVTHGHSISLQPGQAQANGQTLVPQAGASIPATVNLQPGQAVANGQTLVPRVSVTVTIQPGQAEALGKQITVVAGHVITLQPGQAIANGQNLIPFTGIVLGIVRDPGSRSTTALLGSRSTTALLGNVRG